MDPVHSDDELLAACRAAVAAGESFTATAHKLRGRRVRFDDKRLLRLWKQAGGPLRRYVRTYPFGTGPKDPWYPK